ncbi:MAG TPA: high-affinity branched-chain amino acid ABC transporter ATP-binding protein LivG [Armatimonadetes bacterium]|nr:high-affinity branched-chain amino acid ABC transporter ATP-binding protein LivG [Armatimonadota bacterium]
MSRPLLQVSGLTKTFGGLEAVSDVAFDVAEGSIKALIGPNGAGKTTIFNLLTSVIPADSGSARFNGHELLRMATHRIAALGIGRTFQTRLLFDQMTVLENVMVGHHLGGRSSMLTAALGILGARAEERECRALAMRALEQAGLADLAGRPASELPIGQRRLVEVARALASEPKLLLMDEPAAGLNMRETDRMGEIIQRTRDGGVTVLLVEHDMSLVMSISEEILVLDGGRRLAEGPPEQIRHDERVLAAYLGEEAEL